MSDHDNRRKAALITNVLCSLVDYYVMKQNAEEPNARGVLYTKTQDELLKQRLSISDNIASLLEDLK